MSQEKKTVTKEDLKELRDLLLQSEPIPPDPRPLIYLPTKRDKRKLRRQLRRERNQRKRHLYER